MGGRSIGRASRPDDDRPAAAKPTAAARRGPTSNYRKLRLNRFTWNWPRTAARRAESVVEEEQRDSLAAQALAESSAEAVSKARADYAEAKVNTDAAKTEIELRKAMYDVSVRDKEMAEAQTRLCHDVRRVPTKCGRRAQYRSRRFRPKRNHGANHAAHLRGPSRSGDDRDGSPRWLRALRDARRGSRIPGSAVSFAHGKITRYSPSIRKQRPHDARREVDLFNGSARRRLHQQFVRDH